MWCRIFAIFVARNREFYRDRAGLGWNIFMPMLAILSFAFIFGSGSQAQFKVGVLTPDGAIPEVQQGFLALNHIQFIPLTDLEVAVGKVERHQIDLLLEPGTRPPTYWVNEASARGYLVEQLFLATASQVDREAQENAEADFVASEAALRRTRSGAALTYAEWVVPGILAMNLTFSSLWGVGWVIVRYRKNGVLRRLKATPLRPFEFLTAQVFSRLLVVMSASLIIYAGAWLILDFPMRGSYVALLLLYLTGALCLISFGLIVSARLRTEEVADGVLNLISWPMLLLSGAWFSLEGASDAARFLAQLLPLTHLVEGARQVMIDGAGVAGILPQVTLLALLALLFLSIAAWLFRWE